VIVTNRILKQPGSGSRISMPNPFLATKPNVDSKRSNQAFCLQNSARQSMLTGVDQEGKKSTSQFLIHVSSLILIPRKLTVSRTSSKANTEWSMDDLGKVLPKIIYKGLSDSRYYAKNQNAIKINCDEHRQQSANKKTTHQRLANELERIFKTLVPGVTTVSQREKITSL
jgi:hypothetical protein